MVTPLSFLMNLRRSFNTLVMILSSSPPADTFGIHDASEDPVRHLPYAPYIMHVIEQLPGIQFPIDS